MACLSERLDPEGRMPGAEGAGTAHGLVVWVEVEAPEWTGILERGSEGSSLPKTMGDFFFLNFPEVDRIGAPICGLTPTGIAGTGWGLGTQAQSPRSPGR